MKGLREVKLDKEFSFELMNGDCIEKLRELPENSVDTCITDPPYELGFMGKKWDSSGIAFQPETWQAVYRVLKPGALLLAFGGTRTYHRMVCAIEDAGFEIRDTIAWVYGSGFPKSYDISKGMDKKAGVEREVVGKQFNIANKGNDNTGRYNWNTEGQARKESIDITAPATPEAQLWHGWGTALKPSHEPIVVAMKPIDGTYVNNALTWGVAGLWIDGGRVATDEVLGRICTPQSPTSYSLHDKREWVDNSAGKGRFPANFIHDGSDEVLVTFPQTKSGKLQPHHVEKHGHWKEQSDWSPERDYGGDSGSAARFFMTCKQDDLCSLCLTPKHSIMSNIDNSEVIQCKSLFANSVQDWLIEKAVHVAKSVGNLCEECATSIVREVVEIKTWDSKNVVSPVIQDFIGNSNKCILIQNLAQYAEIWDSIDTTPTTTSLLTLFGYARRVITNYIQETEKTAPKRFLYSPKASRKERNAGLEGMEEKVGGGMKGTEDQTLLTGSGNIRNNKMQNHHPTVKPIELMRYLVRLTKTPTGGVVLDPFMGSGTTGIACVLEGREFIGIELEPEYFELAKTRIQYAFDNTEALKEYGYEANTKSENG